jgi:hypothetical protein
MNETEVKSNTDAHTAGKHQKAQGKSKQPCSTSARLTQTARWRTPPPHPCLLAAHGVPCTCDAVVDDGGARPRAKQKTARSIALAPLPPCPPAPKIQVTARTTLPNVPKEILTESVSKTSCLTASRGMWRFAQEHDRPIRSRSIFHLHQPRTHIPATPPFVRRLHSSFIDACVSDCFRSIM